jgi:quercetin dioxygenase-like cupin family protein
MSEIDRDRAAEFALGLLPASEGARLARAAESDALLAGEIAWWDTALAPLQADVEVSPPAEMFERIQRTIASRSRHLPGTVTVRADDGQWETICEGVERKLLWAKGPHNRETFLVRMAPGARYGGHEHAEDEECYVISGDITFDTLTLHDGDYHLARRGALHPSATSAGGCLLLITAAAA